MEEERHSSGYTKQRRHKRIARCCRCCVYAIAGRAWLCVCVCVPNCSNGVWTHGKMTLINANDNRAHKDKNDGRLQKRMVPNKANRKCHYKPAIKVQTHVQAVILVVTILDRVSSLRPVGFCCFLRVIFHLTQAKADLLLISVCFNLLVGWAS